MRNFSNVGIFLAPSPASPANYTVVDTTVANNPAVGVYLAPPSGNITGQLIALLLKRDLLIANGDGLRVNSGLNNSFQGSLEATLVDVAASGNLNNAFAFHSNPPLATADGVVHNSQETDSPVGLVADNSAVWLERSLLDSPTTFTIGGGFGFIYSAGDNRMTGFPSMAASSARGRCSNREISGGRCGSRSPRF